MHDAVMNKAAARSCWQLAHNTVRLVAAKTRHKPGHTLARAVQLLPWQSRGQRFDQIALHRQVVVRVRPMFDVEAARSEQYAVQTNPEDPRHVQVAAGSSSWSGRAVAGLLLLYCLAGQ
jgi:hypothetical protein